jgi:hypothetical protein
MLPKSNMWPFSKAFREGKWKPRFALPNQPNQHALDPRNEMLRDGLTTITAHSLWL